MAHLLWSQAEEAGGRLAGEAGGRLAGEAGGSRGRPEAGSRGRPEAGSRGRRKESAPETLFLFHSMWPGQALDRSEPWIPCFS